MDYKNQNKDIDPRNNGKADASGPIANKSFTGMAFSRLSRELSEEDLNAPGTKKMILDKLDALTMENLELKAFQTKYYDVDKNYAVLSERYGAVVESANVRSIFSIAGSVLLGTTPWMYDHKFGWGIIVISSLLSMGMIIAPFVLRNKGSSCN